MQSEIEGADQLWTSYAAPDVCLFQNKVVFLLRTVSEREGSKILSMQTKFWPTESFKGSFLGTEGGDMVTQRQ